MRVLRVVGLVEDGANVLCEDPDTGDHFAVPADERLRAAARGDLSRFGQLEIDMESQLRPRDIQARIRAGASVEQVAAAAGTTAARIDRYAYPVLLERSSIAQKARSARTTEGRRSVEDLVTATLHARGQGAGLSWDAYREDGTWLLVARWNAGRSNNRALFAFHPGPGGGTVTPHDEAAADLLNPEPRPLRTIAQQPAATPEPAPGRTHPAGSARPSADLEDTQVLDAVREVETTVTDPRAAADPAAQHGAERARRTGTDDSAAPARSKRGHRPAMPSWEDVLLGTRSADR